MREIPYKKFSWNTHKTNWQSKRPNVCQFELTFKCGLNCTYCYSTCYNKPEFIKNELDTEQIKFILDEVYGMGALWLCFTGGDPLTRFDFLEIYSYAKEKGFIITIFTNGYSMREKIADYLKKMPPFVIEITLNGATKETYEKTSQIKGAFEKTKKGINLILERRLPLKIKTQITKDNLKELPSINRFIENLGLTFRPSPFLHARLNGDLLPYSLRIDPEELPGLDERLQNREGRIDVSNINGPDTCQTKQNSKLDNNLFKCTIGSGDGVNIDPYGNIFPCNCIREPKVNLLKENIKEAHEEILSWVRTRYFNGDSKCKYCPIRDSCYNCPGKAFLEKRSLEGISDWYCKLAHLTSYVETKR